MIATVTLNPAIDYTVSLADTLRKDAVNRTAAERLTPGGKGINVSVILHRLGVPTVIHGIPAGMTGQMLCHTIADMGIQASWLPLNDGSSNRINMKLADADGITEINGSGITMTAELQDALLRKLQSYGEKDIIVLAGSIPKGADKNLYGNIMAALQKNGVQFAVDAEGDSLRCALRYHPLIIKPNLPELCGLFDVQRITGDEDLYYYAQLLQREGARNVLISLGGDGAFLLTEGGTCFRMEAPKGKIQSTVGAGDSMLAGWLAGYVKGCTAEECLRMGIAAGSATAFAPWLAERSHVEACLQML